MKPRKAWTVAEKNGKMIMALSGSPILRRTKVDAAKYETYNMDGTSDGSHAVRVRIVEDAAVERAIEALRESLGIFRELAIESAGGPRYNHYSILVLEREEAIRDLGGRP